MSRHQVIYTSCRRGINGVNDGQQVFSYDKNFAEVNNDEVKSLFSYQQPTLPPGIVMTEELAETMPQTFIYRRLRSQKSALALNTYLGRDYMGSAGRFGNFLSHVIVADESEFEHYPCEYYGSDVLRSKMTFEEVNNPEIPDYLPVPILEKGTTITSNTVIDFLNEGDRVEFLKQMVAAVLAFSTQKKRLVICDHSENIILWIAAIEYLFPKAMALNIDFSTYEFNPSLSSSQICGVLPTGTRYSIQDKALHFVFDFMNQEYETFDTSDIYFDFVDAVYSISFSILEGFHEFFQESLRYNQIDEKMYSAYHLYALKTHKITSISVEALETALSMAQEYATKEANRQLIQNFLQREDELRILEIDYFMDILSYLTADSNLLTTVQQELLKQLIVKRVLTEFLSDAVDEKAFRHFFDAILGFCQRLNFKIETELMDRSYRSSLFNVFLAKDAQWKRAYVIHLLTSYVQQQQLPVEELDFDAPVGKTYSDIIWSVYQHQHEKVDDVIQIILESFSWDECYLVNMTLNIEGLLFDLSPSEPAIDLLWNRCFKLLETKFNGTFNVTYQLLANYQRWDKIYELFTQQLNTARTIEELENTLQEHNERMLTTYSSYQKLYEEKILSDYYRRLNQIDPHHKKSKLKLFNQVSTHHIVVPFGEALVIEIVNQLSFEKPSYNEQQLIYDLVRYVKQVLHQELPSPLLVLWLGVLLLKNPINEVANQLEKEFYQLQKNNLAISYQNGKVFLSWALPEVVDAVQTRDDIDKLMGLCDFTTDLQHEALTILAEQMVGKLKKDYHYQGFYELLKYAADVPDNFEKDLAKLLGGFNKQKLSEIDDIVREKVDAKEVIDFWEQVKEKAEATNPFVHNIVNFFKKKK